MAANREREVRVNPANWYFMEAVSRQPAYLISLSAKGYRERGPESAFLSITVMIFFTGYLGTDFVLGSLREALRCPFPRQPPDCWAGDCPSISLTRLPRTQHCPGHTSFAFWSRRELSPLSAAPSFWVCRNPIRGLRKRCS